MWCQGLLEMGRQARKPGQGQQVRQGASGSSPPAWKTLREEQLSGNSACPGWGWGSSGIQGLQDPFLDSFPMEPSLSFHGPDSVGTGGERPGGPGGWIGASQRVLMGRGGRKYRLHPFANVVFLFSAAGSVPRGTERGAHHAGVPPGPSGDEHAASDPLSGKKTAPLGSARRVSPTEAWPASSRLPSGVAAAGRGVPASLTQD